MQTLQQLYSGELLGTTRLKLSCGLKTFPKEIYTLADTLEILDLSGNELSSLPDDFGILKKLKIAFFSDNFFTEFPSVLAKCLALEMIGFKANIIKTIPENAIPINTRWLILTNNAIESIPASIGKCTRMQKLMLAGNRLKALPQELASCKNLELFRISANQIEQFPTELLTFPRLSWLAFAGNPFSENTEEQVALEEFSWDELTIKEQLGEGASGIIAKAVWETHHKEVAVKVYKGEVTSDGLPTDEMNACISAGTHPNLVTVLGKIKNHPTNKHGLLMELIPPTFRNLGGPPSFETCTRDTYPAGTVFTLAEIIKISSAIASVGEHFHALGVSHGDLYAHNTLVDENANTLFGDFGAGSTYHVHSSKAPAIQRLEVRAFACLLDDLLRYVAEADTQHPSIGQLKALVQNCMNEVVLERPSFVQIYEKITGLNA
ncbi:MULTISPECIES: leucine-rich repeat-containing protein kinase family protein [unclassified Arcicella]|uniref:leucine-rich repeat-containing protein kinase family protein n=1 Tax=unclassified Arcicella TaxID=2644986 RepID=UPI002859E770|nr:MULTISPECIES: leucine-rich repeat-containing protein kinase family protein [unclassified Arcicella]MDR6564831.1 hypothetical protein [Arcicella sp. BE51]MDR6826052.1 hypothetical protein [Arcicella sp. BE139]